MRFGLIGTGYWANEVHGASLSAAQDAQLVGVWGRDRRKAERTARRFDVRAYSEPRQLFSDVDAVSFSVPPDVQAPLAVEAADAGCHLLLEKPTGLDVAAADAVLEASRSNGVASVVFFTSRFRPEVAAWLGDVGEKGGWEGAQGIWLGSIYHPGNPFGTSPWRKERGALWDVGPHALSMALPVMGQVVDVVGMRGPGDSVHAVLRHANGGSSSFLVSHTVPEAAARSEFRIYGERGWERMPEVPWDAVVAHQAAVTALTSSVESGDAHPCDAAFGRHVVELLTRIESTLG